MSNEWRLIPSFPDYEASDDGQIRRAKPRRDGRASRPLSQFKEKNGYMTVTLWIDGRTSSQWTHRLVCEAFHGAAPDPSMHAAHGDGVPTNCRAENLSWKTRVENAHDKRIHGTENIGERNGAAVLTEADARDIRCRYAALPRSSGGAKVKKGCVAALAAEYGLTPSGIQSVVTGRTWSHLL